MKVKKLLKICSQGLDIGIYEGGYFLGNYKNSESDIKRYNDREIESIWVGRIYYNCREDFREKLNITLKGQPNE